MDQSLKHLIQLNLEIEGALRTLEARDNADAVDYVKAKFEEFSGLFNTVFCTEMPDEKGDGDTTDIECSAVEDSADLTVDDQAIDDETIDDIVDETIDTDYATDNEDNLKPDADSDADSPIETEEPEQEEVTEVTEATEGTEEAEETEGVDEPVTDTDGDTENEADADIFDPKADADNDHALDDAIKPSDYRVEDMVIRKKSHNLAKAFTINDKFRFIRGLFCEDKVDFECTVAQLSELNSLDEAYDLLLNELGWDIDNDEVKDFISIVANYFNAI